MPDVYDIGEDYQIALAKWALSQIYLDINYKRWVKEYGLPSLDNIKVQEYPPHLETPWDSLNSNPNQELVLGGVRVTPKYPKFHNDIINIPFTSLHEVMFYLLRIPITETDRMLFRS